MIRWNLILLLFFAFPFWIFAKKPSPHLDEHWNIFKQQYNRTYDSNLDKKKRLAWEENYRKVSKHNEEHKKGMHTYTLELNHLADLSQKQYIREMVRLAKSKRKPSNREITSLPYHNVSSIPEELDWRKEGLITDPMNQEDCGSCYAFSVASCIQGQYFKIYKEIKNFSIQQLVDCSVNTGNLGCSGGSLRNTLKYIHSVGGLMLDEEYSYSGKKGVCDYERQKAAVKLKSWGILPPKDEHTLKIAVAHIGPIAVSVNASPSTFQLYSSGIYNDAECISDYVNHAMLLIGYTKEAWILKNWWSEEWGNKGYMLLARGSNKCAIANYAAYAKIENR